MKQNINLTRLSFIIFGILFGSTLIIGCILANVRVGAVETTTFATASVNVSAACTMTSGPTSGGNTYTDTITPGTSAEYGPTTLTATCNDPTGFSIYAIGYSGNSYTASNHTKLISTLSSSYDISTNTPSSAGSNSYWSMKLASVAGDYPATIANSYDNYNVVPDNFTQVAYRTAATDIGTGATGSSVNASYKVGIAADQVADTYTGKVKYTLVHPNTFIAGTYNINFLANGGTGTMPSQTTTSSGTPLYNFEDQTLNALSTGSITPPTGYTFAGWCTVQDQTATSSNPQTTCIGESYTDAGTVIASTVSAVSSGSTTTPGTLNLYAYYSLQTFTCNQQYRLQNADGTWGEYVSDGSTTTTYGNSCTYTKQTTDYKDTADGINDTAATTTATNVTSNQTLSLDFYRNTYPLTVNKNDTAISSASATTTPVSRDNLYRWGQDINISATPNTGYQFTTWSQIAGTTSSFADNTAAATTFTMPKSNATIYTDGEANTYTITLDQNGATTAGTTSVNATYNSSTLSSSITNPSKSYSVSGFTMGTYADDAEVTFPSSGPCTSASTCAYTNTFNGWYNTDGQSGSNPGTEIITTSGALTPSNGWTDANSRWTSTSNQTVYARWTDGTTITLPTITKTGYTCGWSENSSASTYTYQSGYTGLVPTSNMTLYGICVIKSNLSLSVTFDSNVQSVAVRYGSTSGTLMGTVNTSGGSVSGLTYNSDYYLIPTYKSGYEFSSWTKNSGTVGTLYNSTSATNAYYKVGDGSNGVTLASKSSVATITFTAGSNIDLIMVADGSNRFKPQYATSGGSTSLTVAPSTKLIVTVVPKANYKLSSWSGSTSGLASTSLLTTTYTVPSSNATLTAAGTSGTYTTMKSFALSSCTAAGNNVTDERNGISYTVAKFGNYCYMLSNLRLAGGTTLSSSTSNVSSSFTLPSQTTWTSKSQDHYCEARMRYINNEYYYNWYAAKANPTTGLTSSSSCATTTYDNASRGSICPANWTLPTYQDITPATLWNSGANPGMLATSGDFYYGSQKDVGSTGTWWSSTRYSDNGFAYYLYSRGISAGRSGDYKYYGLSVRCMRSSQPLVLKGELLTAL